jgi:hypothetical protein
VVEISICRSIEFECTNANIIQSLIINAEGLIGIFNELLRVNMTITGHYMDGECSVVGFNNGIGDFR